MKILFIFILTISIGINAMNSSVEECSEEEDTFVVESESTLRLVRSRGSHDISNEEDYIIQ